MQFDINNDLSPIAKNAVFLTRYFLKHRVKKQSIFCEMIGKPRGGSIEALRKGFDGQHHKLGSQLAADVVAELTSRILPSEREMFEVWKENGRPLSPEPEKQVFDFARANPSTLDMVFINRVYQHKENRRFYVVVSFCLVDVGTEWVEGVAFRQVSVDVGNLYTRPMTTFKERYEEVLEGVAHK